MVPEYHGKKRLEAGGCDAVDESEIPRIMIQPLGPLLQAYVTTRADVGDLCVIDVVRETRANVVVHHVRTGGGR